MGMIKNVFEGSADLIGVGLSMSTLRAQFVQYLPVLINDRYAIFTGNKHVEQFSLATFINPFAMDLWIVIHLMTAMLALVAFLATVKSKTFSVMLIDYCGWFWTAWAANFGRKPYNNSWTKKASSRTLMLTTLLASNVIWIAYRASITSEFATIQETKPFDSLETLSETNYRLLHICLKKANPKW